MNNIVAFLFVLFVALSSRGQSFQESMQTIMSDNDILGVSVVTLCGGEVDQSFYGGLARVNGSVAVNSNTKYRIASVSKLVTAIGLMKLYDQGLFQLDDDVSDALGFSFRNPNFPNLPITYRMLLSHTSSLQEGELYGDFLSATYSNQGVGYSLQDYTQVGGQFYDISSWSVNSPGTYFQYSNANYGVIGTLIEKHSNQRFDVYMRSEVLEPLNITGSFNIHDLEDFENLATLYRFQGGQWVAQADNFQGIAPSPEDFLGYQIGDNGFLFAPQGGLRCSAEELSFIMKMLMQQGVFNGQIFLQPSTVEQMKTPAWTYNGSNGDNYFGLFRSWGLGIHIITNTVENDVIYPGVSMKGHAGEAYGLVSDFYFNEESGHGIIIIINGRQGGYVLGDFSSFYKVEEEIFQAAKEFSYDTCVNSNKNLSSRSIKVYPNPAFDVIRLEFASNLIGQELKIYNAIGAEVYKTSIMQTSASISVGNWPSGQYYVQMASGDSIFFQKQ